MYKRDYELIAATIKLEVQAVDATLRDGTLPASTVDHLRGMRDGYGRLAFALADKLRIDNPLFKESTFIVACGIK